MIAASPKISLVLATINRTDVLERFFQNLDVQTYKHFEVIVVDQNADDRLVPIIRKHSRQYPVIHLRSEKGLSKARNVGLKAAAGDLYAFPDDDCWYAPDLLAKVVNAFAANPQYDGVLGRPVNEHGVTTLGDYDSSSGEITRLNIWKRANSNTLFFRGGLVKAVGNFDEALGVGAGTAWGSAEDVDYPLRALDKGYRLYYDAQLTVYHPDLVFSRRQMNDRAKSYGAGMGFVMKKHHYPVWFVSYYLARPTGGALINLCAGRMHQSRYYMNVLKGRWIGWRGCQ